MHIDDQDLVPIEIKQLTEKLIGIKTKNNSFNDFISKKKIKVFKQAFPTAHTKWLKDIYVVRSSDNYLHKEIEERFKGHISYVEPIMEPMLTYTPNDYAYAGTQYNLDLVNAKPAWDWCRKLPKIPLAVTDTYFETTHEDLNGQFIGVWGGNNSPNFHGTAVAGLLSAITDNNIGLSAISFNSKIYASTIWGDDNQVLLLAQQGYRIINCSWVNNCYFSSVQDALYREIRDIWNTIVISGAGNNANHCGSLDAKVYPASYNSVISVTSVGCNVPYGTVDPIYGRSGWADCHEDNVDDPATAHHHNDAVDICAPGYNVPSTAGAVLNSGNYGGFWGTSFAAPQVAATACLILSINPCLTATQATNILLDSADPSIYNIPENSEYIGLLGTGRLDVKNAVLQASETGTLRFNSSTNFYGNQTIHTNYAIRSIGQAVSIQPGANVLFKTRYEIELGSGFEVQPNATFEAIVDVNGPITCP